MPSGDDTQCFLYLSSDAERIVDIFRQDSCMTHFSERLGDFLSIQMDFHPMHGRAGLESHIIGGTGTSGSPEQVDHDRGGFHCGASEWQVQDGAEMLFELGSIAAVDGMVAAVMRSGGDFIDKQLAGRREEHLYGQ